MEHEKLLLFSLISLIVGIVICLICVEYAIDVTITIILIGVVVGIIAKGDGLFSKYDDAIVSFVLGFLSFFIALYFFVPFGSLLGRYIFIYSVCTGGVALIANIFKRYFLRPYLEENKTQNAQYVATTPSPALPKATKKCPDCGASVNESAVFCEKCGSKLPESKPNKFCSQCGAEVGEGDTFCDRCGNKL